MKAILEEKDIAKLQKKVDRLWASLRADLGSSEMDLVSELVKAELELESYCNN